MESLNHPNIKCLALDVRNDSQVKSVVATIIQKSGHIDLLINNAGVLAPGALTNAMPVQYNFNLYTLRTYG
jgi:1-acylglycerone phosphate reductase